MRENHAPYSSLASLSQPTLRQQLRSLDTVSSQEADDLVKRGARVGFTALVWVPLSTFLQTYFRRGTWRHGTVGLVSALFAAYAVFVRSMKVWERQYVEKTASSSQR